MHPGCKNRHRGSLHTEALYGGFPFPPFTEGNSHLVEAGRLLFHFELAQSFQDVLHGFFVNLRSLPFQPFHHFKVRIWSHNLSVANFGGGTSAYRTLVVQVAGVQIVSSYGITDTGADDFKFFSCQ